jgi:outer membrane lipoprotein-sorting protein
MKNSELLFLVPLGAVLIFGSTASRPLAAQGEAATPPQASAPVAPAPAHPMSMEGKTAEQYYKNIKVFKGVPASQIIPAMHFIAASLGVRCTFCHVMQGHPPRFDFAKDDKRPKRTARKMVLMMRSINENNFHGRMAVTCATCHNGHPHPDAVPALAAASFAPPGPPPGRPAFQMMPMPPKVLNAYYQAIGGAEAAQKITTRVLKGTLTMGPNRTAPVEIYEKAPDKFLAVATFPNGRTMERGTNGTIAWMSTPRGVMRVSGPEAEVMKRQSDFYGDLDVVNLKQNYPRMRVRGTEKIGGREAYILEAHAVSGGAFERLYFDKENGLLLRVVHFTPTPVGNLPDQTDFSDYRQVEGIKVPFQVETSSTEGVTTETFTDVSLNTPIEDSRFDMPKGANPPAQP